MDREAEISAAEKRAKRVQNAERIYGPIEQALFVPVVKRGTDEQRMVYGFASVSHSGGEAHFDTQGDTVGLETVRKAWRGFMAKGGSGGLNHETPDTGKVVEGLVIDDTVAEALMTELKKGHRGLFIGYHATDDKAWAGVKKGEFKGFSIGGKGRRQPSK
jgi:hypothetical protein